MFAWCILRSCNILIQGSSDFFLSKQAHIIGHRKKPRSTYIQSGQKTTHHWFNHHIKRYFQARVVIMWAQKQPQINPAGTDSQVSVWLWRCGRKHTKPQRQAFSATVKIFRHVFTHLKTVLERIFAELSWWYIPFFKLLGFSEKKKLNLSIKQCAKLNTESLHNVNSCNHKLWPFQLCFLLCPHSRVFFFSLLHCHGRHIHSPKAEALNQMLSHVYSWICTCVTLSLSSRSLFSLDVGCFTKILL